MRKAEERWLISFVPPYRVSSLGRIKNIKGKIIKPQITHRGYKRVCLRREDGSKSYLYVHRLVACAFMGSIKTGLQVNHKDCNKTNNKVWNLEYVTLKENLEHGRLNGHYCAGDTHGGRKLSSRDVAYIRRLKAQSYDRRLLAKKFGVTVGAITRVANNRSWKEPRALAERKP